MDGAAAAVRRDGDGNKPHDGNPAAEDSACPPTEDTERDGVFCCQDCGEAFREEAAYSEHRHQHVQGNVNSDKQFDIFYDAKKDREMANVCTLCSISFVEPSEFHSHMEQKHGETSQKDFHLQINPGTKHPPTYECPECGKCYGVYGHFLNHQRSHSQASKSVFHDLEHLKKKSFQCESCGRSYSRASALDAHRRCHEEKLVKARNRNSGDSFPTEESTVETKPTENQAEHQQQQQNITPEKLFKCPCGKEFTASMRLKTHQRFSRNSICAPEDMKDKPKKICSGFHCNVCDKAFSSHIALYNHQKWHAKLSNDPAKKYTCELCGKVFMTLTFYDRHQRTAHSDETPAKSFLHQVCQLQKKAFECKDCGLKFSRASALQAHQLHHTENFRETEKPGQTFRPPQHNSLESERKETEQQQGGSKSVHPISVAEEALHVNETDEEVESYEPGDFNVQVISASESEDEPAQDVNPDLELLCESDQEQKDDCDAEVSSSTVFSKPDMDLKIVQIDFDQADGQCAPIEPVNYTTEERFDCPDCYRWFTSASSLRVHRMWHSIRKRRQQAQVKQSNLTCKDCGLKFADLKVFMNHLHQHALEEEEEVERGENGENNNEEQLDRDGGSNMSSSLQRNPSDKVPGVGGASFSMKKKHKKVHSCVTCGKVYLYLSSYTKHLKMHNKKAPASKVAQTLNKHECPECGISFFRKARLLGHMRIHRSGIPSNSGYLRCDQCNKNFSSEKSWVAHFELHEQRPFWCLSCSKGFFSEQTLEKHLQSHSLKKHSCNICNKSFRLHTELKHHYNAHSGAKPFLCNICGKAFSHPGNMFSHRKKHGRVLAGSSGLPVGFKKPFVPKMLGVEKHTPALNSTEQEGGASMNELPGKENCMEVVKANKPCESQSLDSAGSDGKDEFRSETRKQKGEMEIQDAMVFNEHEYWEWECCVCDMGFDEVGKLHMHYKKHATGELPIPHNGSLA
ncbi:zinc finger and SCAN domain-containing protein 2 isoform X2 [Cheilinus undulatus]|uniref:zinc finger and SCAN domain-containing protein 2 isoform X2 n=1 Tax=Cheilinus undulatus TaxID=241271 RepID=UPI001BD4F064|nr:zinc finger and SCAN domain-containing protein 2 isoform X2 [Cheilinus undulatus]